MFDEMPSTSNDSPPIKILLAEDDNAVRRYLEITLKRANYEVIAAEDGLAAMKFALGTTVQIIVADAMMPNLTGYDLCRILRQNPNYQNTPFIILSGFEKDTQQTQADAYLTKGENLKEELLETLSNLLVTSELQPS